VGKQKAKEITQGEVAVVESKMEVVYTDLALEKGKV
jgi:hypothetical protein